MRPKLFVVSVGDSHYISGTIYTPNGVQQYNGTLSNFEQLFTLFPTFATEVVCDHDDVCIRDNMVYFYYLVYRDESELEKMLTFMGGESVDYLDYVPDDIIKKLDIHTNFVDFYIGGIDISQTLDCKVIGSIPVNLSITYGGAYINGVKVAKLDESGGYDVCGQLAELRYNLSGYISMLLACYFLNHYKGTPTWSEVLKTWCGIKTSLTT